MNNKVYILTEVTNDGGWCVDEILGIFATEAEAEAIKDELENNEDCDYGPGSDCWLSIDEYEVGKFLKRHMIEEEWK